MNELEMVSNASESNTLQYQLDIFRRRRIRARSHEVRGGRCSEVWTRHVCCNGTHRKQRRRSHYSRIRASTPLRSADRVNGPLAVVV